MQYWTIILAVHLWPVQRLYTPHLNLNNTKSTSNPDSRRDKITLAATRYLSLCLPFSPPPLLSVSLRLSLPITHLLIIVIYFSVHYSGPYITKTTLWQRHVAGIKENAGYFDQNGILHYINLFLGFIKLQLKMISTKELTVFINLSSEPNTLIYIVQIDHKSFVTYRHIENIDNRQTIL